MEEISILVRLGDNIAYNPDRIFPNVLVGGVEGEEEALHDRLLFCNLLN